MTGPCPATPPARAACAIALGSNEGDRAENLRAALAEIRREKSIFLLGAVSSAYETAPVGDTAQPDFLNAAALLASSLSPRATLEAILTVERRLGRVRDPSRRYGPRVIDIDLLLHGETVCDEAGLVIPHPRLAERAFVLVPLAEIAPDLVVPGLGARIGDLALRVAPVGVGNRMVL